MAITEAFPGPSAVVDSLELRKDLAGLIVRDTSGAVRAGVLPRHSNSLVSSTATMSVNVAAFEAALVRTGPLFIQNDGTVAVTIATAPVSNSRIDVVWVRQPENGYNGFADGSNTPLISVTAGTAAASPVKPAIPAGALELATVLVPAGATATNSGGVVITQTFPFTATTGGTVWIRNTTELASWTPADGSFAYVMSLGAVYARVGGAWVDSWLLDDTGWITATLFAPWTVSTTAPAYRRFRGVVSHRGRANSNSATGSPAYAVPAGFRPAITRVQSLDANGTAVRAQVTDAGSVGAVASGTYTALSFDGIAPYIAEA